MTLVFTANAMSLVVTFALFDVSLSHTLHVIIKPV